MGETMVQASICVQSGLPLPPLHPVLYPTAGMALTCRGIEWRDGAEAERLDQSVAQQARQDCDQAIAQEHRDGEGVAQPVALVAAL